MNPMDKVWFILVNGQEEGPYSIAALKTLPQFNPDVLVRKKDAKEWVQARFVAELKKAFQDEPAKEQIPKKHTTASISPDGQLAIDYREDPPLFWLGLLIAAVLVIYILNEIFER